MRRITRESDGLAVEFFREFEDTPIRGHYRLPTGDLDLETEYRIQNEQANGNEYSWFRACVRVTDSAGHSASMWLWCCSYADENEFLRSVYFQDMINGCVAGINSHLSWN